MQHIASPPRGGAYEAPPRIPGEPVAAYFARAFPHVDARRRTADEGMVREGIMPLQVIIEQLWELEQQLRPSAAAEAAPRFAAGPCSPWDLQQQHLHGSQLPAAADDKYSVLSPPPSPPARHAPRPVAPSQYPTPRHPAPTAASSGLSREDLQRIAHMKMQREVEREVREELEAEERSEIEKAEEDGRKVLDGTSVESREAAALAEAKAWREAAEAKARREAAETKARREAAEAKARREAAEAKARREAAEAAEAADKARHEATLTRIAHLRAQIAEEQQQTAAAAAEKDARAQRQREEEEEARALRREEIDFMLAQVYDDEERGREEGVGCEEGEGRRRLKEREKEDSLRLLAAAQEKAKARLEDSDMELAVRLQRQNDEAAAAAAAAEDEWRRRPPPPPQPADPALAREILDACDGNYELHAAQLREMNLLPGAPAAGVPAAEMSWIGRAVGIEETLRADGAVDYDATRENLLASLTGSGNDLCLAGWHVGLWWFKNVGDVRAGALELLRRGQARAGRVELRNVAGDVKQLHVAPVGNGAVFQAASQFNCLEHRTPQHVPEQGVRIYEQDRTQGPACAMMCATATLHRNYLVPVTDTPRSGDGRAPGKGQRGQSQLNGAEDLQRILRKKKGFLQGGGFGDPPFDVRNGYAESSAERLTSLNKRLRDMSPEERRHARDSVRIGINFSADVTDQDAPRGQTVTQVWASALSIGYSNVRPQSLWEPLARLVLEAMYEGTLWAAVINHAREIQCGRPADAAPPPVFLTQLGGGVFANPPAWIRDAIDHACSEVQRAGAAADVRIVHFVSDSSSAWAPSREWAALEDHFPTVEREDELRHEREVRERRERQERERERAAAVERERAARARAAAAERERLAREARELRARQEHEARERAAAADRARERERIEREAADPLPTTVDGAVFHIIKMVHHTLGQDLDHQVNYDTATAFVIMMATMFLQGGATRAAIEIMYHWTPEKNFDGIKRHGLRVPGGGNGILHANDAGYYGKGVYASPVPSLYKRYGEGAQKCFVLLALAGRKYPATVDGNMGGDLVAGHDSHVNDDDKDPHGGPGTQFVFFDSAMVQPGMAAPARACHQLLPLFMAREGDSERRCTAVAREVVQFLHQHAEDIARRRRRLLTHMLHPRSTHTTDHDLPIQPTIIHPPTRSYGFLAVPDF